MAYGNWGAWVYRDGELKPDWCDQTPYRETEIQAGYFQAFSRSEGLDPHHAVLGEKRLRLCGYKSYPVLFVDGEKVSLAPYVTEVYETWTDREGVAHESAGEWRGTIDGYEFGATFDTDSGNQLDLWLTEPDGVKWTSHCGYEYGAGHDDPPVSLSPSKAKAS